MIDFGTLFIIAIAILFFVGVDLYRAKRKVRWYEEVVEHRDSQIKDLTKMSDEYRSGMFEARAEPGELRKKMTNMAATHQVAKLELQKKIAQLELDCATQQVHADAWRNMTVVLSNCAATPIHLYQAREPWYFEFDAVKDGFDGIKAIKGTGETREIALQDAVLQLAQFLGFELEQGECDWCLPVECELPAWQEQPCGSCLGSGTVPAECRDCSGDAKSPVEELG